MYAVLSGIYQEFVRCSALPGVCKLFSIYIIVDFLLTYAISRECQTINDIDIKINIATYPAIIDVVKPYNFAGAHKEDTVPV